MSDAAMHSEAIVMPTRWACGSMKRISAGVSSLGPRVCQYTPAVDQRRVQSIPPGVDHPAPPPGVEPGQAVRPLIAERRLAGAEGDEVVRADERPRTEVAPQPADRADGEHPLTALLGEGSHVREMVDPMREDIGAVAMTLQVTRLRKRDLEPAEHASAADGEPAHRGGSIIYGWSSVIRAAPARRAAEVATMASAVAVAVV